MTILYSINDFQQAYALRTLDNYLISTGFEHSAEFCMPGFHECPSLPRIHEILAGKKIVEGSDSYDLEVTCFSDLPGFISRDQKGLEVDISILNNSTMPTDEKKALRTKYGVNSDRPVLVIGYAKDSDELRSIVEECSHVAEIYLISNGNVLKSDHAHVHEIDSFGYLRDYFALADVAINAENLRPSNSLHNFVEATGGGPLFMVKPDNVMFGYNELADLDVIREYRTFEELLPDLIDYLKTWSGKDTASARRSQHLTTTREVYLPIVQQVIESLLTDSKAPNFDEVNMGKSLWGIMRIQHPETNWRLFR